MRTRGPRGSGRASRRGPTTLEGASVQEAPARTRPVQRERRADGGARHTRGVVGEEEAKSARMV
eukprot:8198171-Pyramimonas_sp.AAC.1